MAVSEVVKQLDRWLGVQFRSNDDVMMKMLFNAMEYFDTVDPADRITDEGWGDSFYRIPNIKAIMSNKTIQREYNIYKRDKQKFLQEKIDWETQGMSPAERDKYVELKSESLKNACKVLPSPFQNVLDYSILMQLAERVENTIKTMETLKPFLRSKVNFCSFPTGNVEAKRIPIPSSNEYLVIFDDGMFRFPYQIIGAIVKALKRRDNNFISIEEIATKKNIDENPDLINPFLEALYLFTVRGGFGAGPSYRFDPTEQEFSNMLLFSVEAHVMGHEYGHIIDRHSSKEWPRTSFSMIAHLPNIPDAWKQEYIADDIGAEIVVAYMANQWHVGTIWSYLGIDLFFTCFHILLEAISILYTGDVGKYQEPKSHPPMLQRRNTLQISKILEYGDREVELSGKGILGHTEQLRASVNILWERVIDKFLELHKQGVRPHGKWSMMQDKHSF